MIILKKGKNILFFSFFSQHKANKKRHDYLCFPNIFINKKIQTIWRRIQDPFLEKHIFNYVFNLFVILKNCSKISKQQQQEKKFADLIIIIWQANNMF